MEQLQLILRQKTAGTLDGIKRKHGRIITFLLAGIFLNVLIHPFLHFLLGEEGPVFRLTYGGMLSLLSLVILCLIVVFYYWMEYAAMNTEVPEGDLKLVLTEKIRQLSVSFRREITLIISLFMIIFIVGRATSQYLGHGDFFDIFHQDILLAMLAGFAILFFYIYKRTVFYRKYIKELRGYWSTINEESDM